MSLEIQLSKEEELLDKALANGEIDQQQYNEEIREIHMEFRDALYEQEREDFLDRVENW